MKTTVTFSDFVDGFTKLELRKDQFSYDGLKLIFDYLESFEEDGEEIEFDPIGICSEFTETTVPEFNSDYGDYGTKFSSIEEIEEYLGKHTSVIGRTEDSIVFENY